jgi:predicted nucleic acid-binding protein
MSVRNCAEIGQNLQKIITALMANNELVNLLYYTDKDPLSQPNLMDNEKKKEIFNNLIRIIPKVTAEETVKSIISITIESGTQDPDNKEFKNLSLKIETFCPFTQWIIKSDNLRPFLILGNIQKTLNGLTINGLGKLKGGDFDLGFLTDEVSNYIQYFEITTYD